MADSGSISPVDIGDSVEKMQDEILSTKSLSEKNRKKGFRIDDILFSVTKNVDQYFNTHDRSLNCSPVLRSLTPESLCSLNNEDHSPVSFVSINASMDRQKLHCGIESHSREAMSPTRSKESFISGYDADSPGYPGSPPDSKKPRTSFTPDQIQTLEDSFNEKRYLNHTERMLLANELNLTDCQIKTWFQNRRMKMKRQYKEAVEKGYLIPFHPYPFPRYSRLTPAHFAAAPGINSRHFLSEAPSSMYMNGMTNSCTCCVKESRMAQNPRCNGKDREKFRHHMTSRCYMPCHSNQSPACSKGFEQVRHAFPPRYEDERKYIERSQHC